MASGFVVGKDQQDGCVVTLCGLVEQESSYIVIPFFKAHFEVVIKLIPFSIQYSNASCAFCPCAAGVIVPRVASLYLPCIIEQYPFLGYVCKEVVILFDLFIEKLDAMMDDIHLSLNSRVLIHVLIYA